MGNKSRARTLANETPDEAILRNTKRNELRRLKNAGESAAISKIRRDKDAERVRVWAAKLDPIAKREYLDRKNTHSRKTARMRLVHDPNFAASRRIRSRLNKMFTKNNIVKTFTSENLLGCSWAVAVAHLENNSRGLKLTDPGVHVDHIRPLHSFKNLSSIWEQKTANNIENLQLLTAKENLQKGKSFDYDTWAISESGKKLLELNRAWRMETFFTE
jgi:5-methylcytosine-specific restriction endonuclease McrA